MKHDTERDRKSHAHTDGSQKSELFDGLHELKPTSVGFTDLIRVCEGRIPLGPYDYPASDDPWDITEVDSVDELIEAFRHGNWSIRTGFVLDDLAFVEQVGGGNEWLALKRDEGEWKTFDSISFYHMLERNGDEACREYIERMQETPWHGLKYPQTQTAEQPNMGMEMR